MLANAAGNTVNSLKQAEQLSIDALQGKADMRAVVDTVMSASSSPHRPPSPSATRSFPRISKSVAWRSEEEDSR